MRIQQISLQDFRGFSDLKINFKSPVTVLFGWNGTGKTTILDAIGKGLYLISTWSKGGSDTSQFDFEPDDINNTAEKAVVNLDLLFQDRQVPCSFQITHNAAVDAKSNSLKYSGLLKSIWGTENLPVLAYYRSNREIQAKNPFKSRTWNRYTAYTNAFVGQTNDFVDFIHWYRDEEDIENQLKIEKQDLDLQNPKLTFVRKALESFLNCFGFENPRLRVKRSSAESYNFRVNQNGTSLVLNKGNTELKLTQLSAGERSLLMLAADIARRASIANPHLSDPLTSEGIVLIDEIELHLHPKWQRAVIPALRSTFPNIQFIIATHSPQVLSSVENGSVFEIEDFKAIPRDTFGRDNSWMLEVVMDDEPRVKEVQEQLNNYFELIKQDDLVGAAALRQELESKLGGSDDPAFVKADILIKRKERLLSSL